MPLIHVLRLPLLLLAAIEGVRAEQHDLRQHPHVHLIDGGPRCNFGSIGQAASGKNPAYVPLAEASTCHAILINMANRDVQEPTCISDLLMLATGTGNQDQRRPSTPATSVWWLRKEATHCGPGDITPRES